MSAGPTRAGVAEFVGDNSCRSVLGERIGVLAGLAEPAGTVTGPGSGAVRMSGRVSSTGSRCGGVSGGDGWWVAGGGAGVLADGAGVADRGPGDEVQQLTSSSDGVGSFAEHGVVEEPVAGLGVVAPGVDPLVVGVVGGETTADEFSASSRSSGTNANSARCSSSISTTITPTGHTAASANAPPTMTSPRRSNPARRSYEARPVAC